MHSNRQRGITLMELMIVMVVVAILAAIAYPSYRQQMMRSQRSTAKTALTQAVQGLERCFTRFNAYNDAGCPIAANLAGAGYSNPEASYQISAVGGAVGATAFQLQAVPLGAQANDTCGALQITQTNVQTATGGDRATCWGR